jgi:hypothetical protein
VKRKRDTLLGGIPVKDWFTTAFTARKFSPAVVVIVIVGAAVIVTAAVVIVIVVGNTGDKASTVTHHLAAIQKFHIIFSELFFS